MQSEQIHLEVQNLAKKITHLLALHQKQQTTMQQLQKENEFLRTQLKTRDNMTRKLAHKLMRDTPASKKKNIQQSTY